MEVEDHAGARKGDEGRAVDRLIDSIVAGSVNIHIYSMSPIMAPVSIQKIRMYCVPFVHE